MDSPRRFVYQPQVGCLLIVLMLATLCVLPQLVVGLTGHILAKLHLPPQIAGLLLLAMFVGSVINLPVRRFERWVEQPMPAGGFYRWLGYVPAARTRTQTILAVNVGGCVLPLILAAYELWFVLTTGSYVAFAMLLAVAINVVVCYLVARPIPGIGVAMPAFVSPLVCVGVSWLLLMFQGEARAPVAYLAGVMGPLVGADLLHLRHFTRVPAGVISIGGAGTFDGIVLSGMLAALLA